MSKVDAHLRPAPEAQAAPKHRERFEGKEDFLKAMAQAIRAQRFEGSRVVLADIAKSGAEVREVAAETFLRVLQGAPGFTAPVLSSPPTAGQIRALLKQVLQSEKQGLLTSANYAQATPESARKESTPIGKAWGDFVQAPTAAQNTQNKPIDNVLGEDTSLFEGAGLRSPQLMGEPFAVLTNKQKLTLMSEAFGPELAMQLKSTGIRDPLALLSAAVTPTDRAALAQTLGVSRGELLVHLARSELMLIGAGRGGEQALRPQHLPALAGSGIVTLTQLAAVRGLSAAQLEGLYQHVRGNYSGFARAMSGERPILKKDLAHWGKSAARKRSSILDADWDDAPQRHGDAEEQIMAWYLQHFAELEEKQARQRSSKEALKLAMPLMRADPARDDGLICYWIEKPNFDAARPTFAEAVYVCLDPKTGVVDPRQKE